MRVVFMGTPEFAVASLQALANAMDVVGVFSRPDAVSGRGRRVRPSAVTAAANALGLAVFQPPTLRDDAALQLLATLEPDLVVVAAYGLILPPAVLGIGRLGAINVHASLLPRWRGAAPIQRAILADDAETGVSIMRMEAGLDTGPYCLQVSVPIGDLGAAELTARLANVGANALLRALPGIADDSAVWTAQDETRVTYAEKITKDDVAIAPETPTRDAWLRIRASLPAAPCRISVAGRSITLLSACTEQSPGSGQPSVGRVACVKDGVLLGMCDGALLVDRVTPEGKSEMSAADWARGVRDLDGADWVGLR